VGRTHRAHNAIVEKAEASLLGGLEEMERRIGVEEVGASHSSSVGSGSDAGSSDASARNGAGAGGV
jgi:hypothetical protein